MSARISHCIYPKLIDISINCATIQILRVIMDTRHISYMKRAIELADYAGERGEIPVGALIVRDGEIIAEAWNMNRAQRNPVKHAEILAIAKACEFTGNERLTGCNLYVTKEPCTMCAGAIIHARIETVYIGTADPKYGACGTVFDVCGNSAYNHVPRCEFNILQDECSKQLKEFFRVLRS